MDATGIVEALNKKFEWLQCKKGIHFVLLKSVKPALVKAYKEYSYILWYINNKKKYIVDTITITSRVVTDSEEKKIISNMEEELLLITYDILLNKDRLNLMLNGEFQGD